VNKYSGFKVIEIACFVLAILSVAFMVATTISHNSFCLLLAEVCGIAWCGLGSVYFILLSKKTQKKSCLIGAALSFVVAVFLVCVAIGII